MLHDRSALPDALASLDLLASEAGSREPHVFLDYDGTLTPIVSRPEDAVMDEAMRRRVRQLAQRHFVAVISGRGLDDLVDRVGLHSIFYAGSHGFELRHPDGRVEEHADATTAAGSIEDLAHALAKSLGQIGGVQLERKRFGLAVHYRRAAEAAAPEVKSAVRETAERFPGLTVKSGKKVLEFVPALDWDKGQALRWILETVGHPADTVWPLFIGDDVTDEDAFRTVDGWGCGIAVGSDGPQETSASRGLADVAAVGSFLDALAERL